MNRIKNSTYSVLLLVILSTLSSCDLITGIFKGGVYVGVILVLVVVGLIIWLISSMRK